MAEDWDLYLRMGEITRLANLDRVLLSVRVHAGLVITQRVTGIVHELDRQRLVEPQLVTRRRVDARRRLCANESGDGVDRGDPLQ